MQIKRDKNTQLKNIFINKFDEESCKEGELLIKITKRKAVDNSTNGYLIEIDVLQFIHLPLCINQLIKGIFSLQVN